VNKHTDLLTKRIHETPGVLNGQKKSLKIIYERHTSHTLSPSLSLSLSLSLIIYMSQFIYQSTVQQNPRKPIKKPVRKIASMDEGAADATGEQY